MHPTANNKVLWPLITALMITVASGVAFSDDVQLNPGFIAGTVRVGTTAETAINRVEVIAQSGEFTSQGTFRASPPA